ncbi:MAG TPA: leucine-rich repeat protein, partial [Candidatus Scatomorpha stercoravium]|nr:leucine-rich repeat protein [Candidatus Scatomorpha stercoravium]
MKQLTKITFEEGVEEISSGSMVDSCSALTTIVLPSTLKYISGNATFSDAAALTDINLPEGVTFSNSNGVSHFSGCTSLESIELPTSMSVIPSNMFKGCTALTTVTAKGTITKIENNAFENCKNLVTLPDLSNVTSIEDYAFRYCEKLTEVDLSSVTELGMYAFGNCASLSGVLDLSNLVSIGTRAFSSCGIEGVIFGESLESIGNYAFTNSSISGKVVIPDSVTSIGSAAFSGTNVTEFYIGSGVKELPTNALASVALEKVTVNNSKDGIVGIDDALPFNFKAEDVVYLHVSIDDDVGDTISTGGPTLQQAVNAGGTVKIEKHVKLSAPVTVPAGVNVIITADDDWQIIGTSATTTSIENLFKVESGASVEFTGNVILSGRYNKESIIDNAGTVTLSGNASVQDGTPAANSSVIDTHGAGAAFIIKGGSVQNNTVSGANVGTVEIGGGARFEMSGGYISGNKWTTGTAYASTPGVLLYNNASGTMSGGYISNNRGCRGTGILLYGYDSDVRTSFTMTGGYITGNTGVNSGNVTASGAVHVENNAEFNMSGGEISGNTGYSGGGVTVVDGKVQNGSGSWEDTEFNMTAGAISGNRANGSGGGVYSYSDGVTLSGGSITGNSAGNHGGGVYSEGNFDNYSTMHIYNALVTNNTANQGGGLWYCVTGSTTVYVHEGCAVYENTAKEAGDDFVIGGESSGKYTATLANRMLGGGAVKWYRDGGVYRAGSTLIPSVDRSAPRYGDPDADKNPV